MAASPTSSAPERVTVIFDGTCGFCTRSVRYLHALDRHGRITTVACQEARDDPGFRLGDIDCDASVWAITPDGRRAAGAQAATLIAAVLMGRGWPVTLGGLPGIRQALAFGYALIAHNRHWLPGDTPYCTAHPGKCRGV